MLSLTESVKKNERWLRDFYADIWEVRRILGADGQTVKGAKRLLGKLRERWVDRLMRPEGGQDERGPAIFAGWCNQTENYWPGLFHRYADPRIPGTNNTMERGIKETKQIVRVLARNPKPALRFICHGATIAMVTTRPELPGESFLASRSADEWQSAEAALRAKRRRSGAALRARRNPGGFADSVLERWKKACAGAG